ncbi:hypothetical protein Ancab_026090 [Ancistrocladus abbreviatus]
MVEETSTPQASVPSTPDFAHLGPDQSQSADKATIQIDAPECSESSVKNADPMSSDSERESTMEYADELMEEANKAMEDHDFTRAAEGFSRAVGIRVKHFGELSPECVQAYYKYGCALLAKVHGEANPPVFVPKKEKESPQDSNKDRSVKSNLHGESSMASVSSNVDQAMTSNQDQEAGDDVHDEKKIEDEESGGEDLGQADEDESDLDLAWKMLDLARVIAEKQSGDTMEKVDILSALADVSLERDDIETSLNDYFKALPILERIVEPDSFYIAELYPSNSGDFRNSRICTCLEIGSKAQEAIPYCQKAISVCKSRMERLMDEVKNSSGATSTFAVSEGDEDVNQSSDCSVSDNSVTEKQAEIKILRGFSGELEGKASALEDLQQLVSNPTSIDSGTLAFKARCRGSHVPSAATSSSRIAVASTNENVGSPTFSTAHTAATSGVTDLGVVGRGVKHAITTSDALVSNPAKRPAVDTKGDSNAS